MSVPPIPTSRLAALAGERFDVVVIGGGIIGAGIARDAAIRGLRVALFEKHDFGSGTTAGVGVPPTISPSGKARDPGTTWPLTFLPLIAVPCG